MQQLHLVGFTTDLDQLILSVRKGAKSGSYLVPLDDRLLAEIAEAVRRRNDDQATGTAPPLEVPPEVAAAARPPGGRTRPTSLLTPREIQARLRSGRSIAEVAKEARADEDWITKFASPVIAERAQIIRAARELVFSKPRRGPSAEPLGASVRWNLADRGVRLTDEEFDACWDAYLVGDALWGVTFEAVTRGRQHHAVWEVDFRAGEVFARNRAASDFGFVDTPRRRSPSSLAAESKSTGRAQPARSGAKATGRSTKSGARTSGRAASSARGAKSTARTAKQQPGKRSGERGAPPVSAARAAPAAAPVAARETAAAPVPNELAKHRLRLVQSEHGSERPATRPRPAPARAARAAPPQTPARARQGQAPPSPAGRSGAASLPPSAPPPEDETRRDRDRDRAPDRDRAAQRERAPDRDRAAVRERAPERPRAADPEPEPAADAERSDERVDAFAPAHAPELDVANAPDEEAARGRREERRRARAAARQANGRTGGDVATFEPPRKEQPSLPPPRPATDAPEEGRVVTIRASRAGTAATDNGRDEQQGQQRGDVIVRGGTPALRPARPAVQPVQPRRRRFGRGR